ncbi:MAG: Dabb family protein [Planctomycetaceae bacterium]|nr:Dabb family protein [Planctomycetaceae bacterium]
MLVHSVYFSLHDATPESIDQLVQTCRTLLSGHPGTEHFSAGVLAKEFEREVNVRDFDVALHIIFTDKAAHDRYQVSEAHQRFIAENKSNWRQVRVFDSYTSSE